MKTGKRRPNAKLADCRGMLTAMLLSVLFLAACNSISLREDVVPRPAMPLVTFVFDDGFDTDYLVAKDVFAEQGVVACSAIATDLIDRP